MPKELNRDAALDGASEWFGAPKLTLSRIPGWPTWFISVRQCGSAGQPAPGCALRVHTRVCLRVLAVHMHRYEATQTLNL